MNAIIISIGFIVSHLIWNIFYAAHVAMNSSMTEVREERIAMASNRGMFNSLGTICFSLVSMPLILMIGKAIGNPAGGYTFTVILGGIIMIACYYILFFMTKDYANAGESTQTGKVEEKMSVGEMLKQIVVNPPLIGLLLGELGRYLGRFVIFGMAFYYFKYVANMKPTEQLISGIKNGMALIPAIIMIVGLIFIVLLYKITPTNLQKMQKEIAVRKSEDVNF